MKTVPKVLILASISMLVFFTTHLVFFDTEVKKLITLNGVDHILHHIVLLKFLVGAIFTALTLALVLDYDSKKDTYATRCNNCGSTSLNYDRDLCLRCGQRVFPPGETECFDCKISKI